jgi:hypothetical protein
VRGETKVTVPHMPSLRTGEDDVGVWAEIDVEEADPIDDA